MNQNPNIPYQEITYQIIGAAMRVHSRLGPGLKEQHYQRALTAELIESGLTVAEEYHVEIYDGEHWLGRLYLDHFVEDRVVVELKAFTHPTTNDDLAQVITYLAATNNKVGLLFNFGRRKLEFRRILPPTTLDGWQDRIQRFLWRPSQQRIAPRNGVTDSATDKNELAEGKEETSDNPLGDSHPLPTSVHPAGDSHPLPASDNPLGDSHPLLDSTLPPLPLSSVPEYARAAEAMGFDTLWTTETQHNPFLPGALIAEHTRNLRFGTAVAIGFARSPATLAYTAWDLAQASGGRFILGLGTQVRAHIERRFGMPWPESPVGKLREQIQAIRAFWHTWQTGERLNFRGDYYKLTLMSPFFDPGPIEHPDIPIYIAGVNTGLARLAGEVADGFHVHPLHSPRYLREVILPAISGGLQKSGREGDAVKLAVTAFAASTPEERDFVRAQIAFYASTPSYRRVFALHGWEETAQELSKLAARQRWAEMGSLIDDEMLAAFAVIADPEDLPAALEQRYRGLADHLTLYVPFTPGERDDFWQRLLTELRQRGSSPPH
jgi:probable F420-dependent oxidoreductase/GxxExxY protein